MTRDEAIAVMRTSTTIEEWNNNREVVKNACTNKQWNQYFTYIDAMGLAVEVLGKDDEDLLLSRNK
jgi:hypothetical protein